MASSNQLYLLADHIKLSLLERQRALSLNIEPSSQDGHISRSLDQMREGIESLEQEQRQLLSNNDSDAASTLADQSTTLRSQYDDLTSQFRGFPASTTSTVSQPNDPALAGDFEQAKTLPRPRNPSSSSFLKKNAGSNGSPTPSKSVRFRDSSPPPDAQEMANRAALFPYRDDPNVDNTPDHGDLDNQQIHSYHKQVLQEQDQQLDRLGESIGRQRDLSIQIGDELDDHVQMLDEVEGHMDRQQGRLDGARRQLGGVARAARDNKQITTIIVLIIILVFLIVILKS